MIRTFYDLIMTVKYHLHICQESGCWKRDAFPCFDPDYEEQDGWLLNMSEAAGAKPDGYYCSEHAHKWGYCWCCGQFYAGVESFDFSRSGLCENCEADNFDDEEEWDPDAEYPYD